MTGDDATNGAKDEQVDAPTTEREESREAHVDRPRPRAVSGPDQPVDHERTPGVPPPSAVDDDDEDIVDIEGAGSFPASDPPSGW